MSKADQLYYRVVNDILINGYNDFDQKVRPVWRSDGKPAHTLSSIGHQMRFDNSEVAILTTKFVAWKTAIKELLWIWVMKSNVVQVLRDMGVNIWNEWEKEDGTIGKAYGYQLGKKNQLIKKKNGLYLVDQVDALLFNLENDPASRRHITTLWNPDDITQMSLTPCVYETQWYVKGGKLHLEVRCRSNDMPLGNPFNIFQYDVLRRMVAQVLGLELGEYIFNIGDAHVYDRFVPLISEQIKRTQYDAPKLWINPEVKNFYDFTIDDFKLINYNHGGKIDFKDVAI